IALQETHASSLDIINNFNTRFQTQSALWTPSCGLVALSSSYTLTRIPIPEADRALLTRVDHTAGRCDAFFVLVLYAPASSPSARHRFFSDLLTFLPFSGNESILDRLIIAGDFNYDY
ncbi:hypothetical protein BX666DRAFT_1837758, partial [Dichotomocladium elegans]